MSQWQRPPVTPPRADEWDDYAESLGIGGISTGHAYEVTEEEERDLRKERRRAAQRRKPPGFAPWPS